MNISELVKLAHDNAVNKGFYDVDITCAGAGQCDHSGVGCTEKDNCGEYIKRETPIKNKNIGELLMLVVSELGEALEAHRKSRFAVKAIHFDGSVYESNDVIDDFFKHKGIKEQAICAFENTIKDTFEDELADAVIRIADMCGYLGIDLEKHIELKMKYNETREYKHGKRY